jgi:hypothetical protein
MTENEQQLTPDDDALAQVEARASALERELEEVRGASQARLIRAELKVEAVRAGIVDLDGLRLLEIANAKLNDNGEVENAAELVGQLRRAKPWLFNGGSSSSAASAPPAQPLRQKSATEMSDEEYRAARAALLKQYA